MPPSASSRVGPNASRPAEVPRTEHPACRPSPPLQVSCSSSRLPIDLARESFGQVFDQIVQLADDSFLRQLHGLVEARGKENVTEKWMTGRSQRSLSCPDCAIPFHIPVINLSVNRDAAVFWRRPSALRRPRRSIASIRKPPAPCSRPCCPRRAPASRRASPGSDLVFGFPWSRMRW